MKYSFAYNLKQAKFWTGYFMQIQNPNCKLRLIYGGEENNAQALV